MMALGRKVYDAVTALGSGLLAPFSPRRAFLYRHHRYAYRTYVAGQLDGANQNFRPRTRSADADIKRSIRTIVGRCRDQAQNNPSIRGAIRRISNNVVRDGITPQFQFRDRAGKINTAGNVQWEDLFSRWARYADITGKKSFWKIQRLTLEQMWSDGELFIRRVYDDSIPGIPPLRLEMIERDHLDHTVDGTLANGNLARQGKEYDANGRLAAVHLFRQHPGDYQPGLNRLVSERVPASEIVNVWDQDRISQTMGVSWLACIVMEAFDLDDYRAYERIGAKIAAALGIFIKSNYPDPGYPGIGIQQAPGQNPAAIWPTTWANMPDFIEPGRIQSIPFGTDIVVASHNRPGTQYEPYVKESRRTQSTGLGISYEAYANDYTDASYSSTRSGSLEERLSYQGMQLFLDEELNQKIAAWFIESCWLAGLNPTAMPNFRFDPWPYLEAAAPQNPGWTWVDPYKDGQASQLKIQEALSTRRREAAAQGVDWDENLAELMEEEERLMPLYELRARNARIMSPTGQQSGDANALP
ncbi:MAG: phage portal protein [Desulfobulbus sp.]|nr:phage portal protein [Desulfobulbus sp.]